MKIVFDYLIAITGLIIFLPLIIIIATLIKLESTGTVFYRQERVGKSRKLFRIHKFRTMYTGADSFGALTTGKSDARITKTGRVIRKLHLDEIAQLIDVLQGNMSIVGPRPEVPEYTKIYKDMWDEVLSVNPGITGIAAVELSSWEYEILSKAKDHVETYKNIVLPKKLAAELEYVRKHNLALDCKILFRTLKLIFGFGK